MDIMNVSSDPVVLKKRLRVRMSGIREMMGSAARAEADAAIAEKVLAHPAFAAAEVVFTYLSAGNEVDTRRIIREAWRLGKVVAVPRCVDGAKLMEWYRIDDFDGLEEGAFGIEEPPADEGARVSVPVEGEGAAVALVPGYTFDRRGFRVGYGGGYYDRFLPVFGGTSLGLCRRAQFSEEPLEVDEHDVPVDEVVIG